MIGSITSVGQSYDRVSRRAYGRYVEAAKAIADSSNQSQPANDRTAATVREAYGAAQQAVITGPASAPFMAQLAAIGLGDALSGERRVRRDPSQVLARADALYRDGYRRITDLEPGFFGAAEY